MQVELVYDPSCPNREKARLQLLRAFAQLGIVPRWREWDAGSPESPPHVRGYGSPTILVNGRDASGGTILGDGACCRVYANDDGTARGAPAVRDIVSALAAAYGGPPPARPRLRWKLNGALLPAVGVALLPKLFCPACWPAYAGLLGAVGLGFFDYTPYLLPVTTLFLFVAIAGLAWRAKTRHGYRPLLLGILAAGVLLTGKFHFDNDVAMYAGLVLLIAASLWNTWPMHTENQDCTECGSQIDEESPIGIRRKNA
jgi:hypothetical protein